MVAAECEPFAKTGGLADVVDALARALGQLGHAVDVYLPAYRGVQPPAGATSLAFELPTIDSATAHVRLLSAPVNGYRLRLVDYPPFFDRADYYVGDDGRDHPDNGARFALLGRAALEAMRIEGSVVDVLHGHDWHAAPAILLLRHRHRRPPGMASIGTLLTCHNLAYHGWVPRAAVASQLDLPADVGARAGVDLLREGILAADLVNTVSPTYALESRQPGGGAGLEDALGSLGDRYFGIINGLDTALWDPATDAALAARYSADDPSGKDACRAALCDELGLDGAGPIAAMVSRLDPQKGFDLVAAAAPRLLELGLRLVVLGTGDRRLVDGLRELAAARPSLVALEERFDRNLARRIYAGADLFLMPSRFEPCGQGQMIALRYGTLPVVRATGGLADTIVDADARPATGNGFSFGQATPDALVAACRRAAAALADPARRTLLIERAMRIDHSWARPAADYVAAYERAVALAAR